MRWKLLRRRLSISAPRMIVRSHLPWPIRWALAALMLGFSAALALWAFDFGKDIAGLDRDAKAELSQLRIEVRELREAQEKALSAANVSDSLLKTERAAQERLTQEFKSVEAENMALKRDLGFFERLLPAGSADGVAIRGLQAEVIAAGQLRVQVLVMQAGKSPPDFNGKYEITLTGQLDGKPWFVAPAAGAKPLQLKQYVRIEGMLDYPPAAVVKAVVVKILTKSGELKSTQTVKL
jgi:hypothetical protein